MANSFDAESLNAQLGLPPGAWVVPFADYHVIIAGEPRELAAQAQLGPAFTLINAGKVAALWGLAVPWPGMAEAWMVTTPAVRPIAAEFTYAARRFCAIAAQSLKLRRIQIHVQTTNLQAIAWARAARFKPEAVLEAYTRNGEDVYVMKRIFKETP